MQTPESDWLHNDNHESRNFNCEHVPIAVFTNIILEISTLLLESGAHCERINRNIQRIAVCTSYNVEMLLSFTAVSVSVSEKGNIENTITANRRIRHHGVHFGLLTKASLLTWQLRDKEVTFSELANNIEQLRNSSRYSVWIIRIFIGIACGCLCMLTGGDFIDSGFTFIASFIGLMVRQEMVRTGFNLMLSITCSSFITTTISGLNVLFDLGVSPTTSVATAVLFLIPGVPLINSIIDIIEGYVPTGLARGSFGAYILLCIAVGMFLSMALIGINNF